MAGGYEYNNSSINEKVSDISDVKVESAELSLLLLVRDEEE